MHAWVCAEKRSSLHLALYRWFPSNLEGALGESVGGLLPHSREQAETRALGRAQVKALSDLLNRKRNGVGS